MVSTGVSGLRVGQTCEITIEAAEGGGQYSSRIEEIDGASVKVAMPTSRGQFVVPPVGRQVQIKVLAAGGGTVFLTAEVTGRQNQPVPMLAVRVVSASQQQTRSYYRADITVWPTECSVWGEPHVEHSADNGHPAGHDGHEGRSATGEHGFWRPIKGSVHDLSGGGAALLVHEHLRQGDRVKVRFPIPHGGGEVAVTGEVRRSINRGADEEGHVRWDVGLAFENVSAELRDRLVKAVNRVQAEERRRQQAGG